MTTADPLHAAAAPTAIGPATTAKSVKGSLKWGDILLRTVAGLVLLYLFLPIFVIVLFSFNNPQGKFNYSWQGFTLDNWLDPFKYPALTEALQLSLNVAAVSTAVALVLGSLVAIALVRQRWRGQRAVDTFLVLPLTAPEVVMGAALLVLFLDLGWATGYVTIVLAHIAFEVSFIAMTVRARVRGFDWTLEDASLDLGAGPTRTFFRVTLPLIVPGLVAAAMLSFALSLDDFIITYFVSGSTVTYPLYVNAAVKAAVPPQINVLATAILVISLVLLAAGTLYRRKRIDAGVDFGGHGRPSGTGPRGADTGDHDEGQTHHARRPRHLVQHYEADHHGERRFQRHQRAERGGGQPAQRQKFQGERDHRQQDRQPDSDQEDFGRHPGQHRVPDRRRGHQTGDRHRDRQAVDPGHRVTDALGEQDVEGPEGGRGERVDHTDGIHGTGPRLGQQQYADGGQSRPPQAVRASAVGDGDAEWAKELQRARRAQRYPLERSHEQQCDG